MEFVELFMENIHPGLYIILLATFALGMFLKLYPQFKAEYTIPTWQLIFAIVFSFLWIIRFISPDQYWLDSLLIALIQGLLISAVAVFGYQQAKQWLVKRKDDAVM